MNTTQNNIVGAAPAAVAGPAEPLVWTPGPNEFKDWCAQWFGPDSDDNYLAEAVHALPPMAQRFARLAAAPALEAPAAPARIVADALIRLDAIYWEQAQADCDEPPKRPDWLVNALHVAAAAPQAPAAPWVMPVVQVHPLETAPKDGTIVQLLVQFVDHPPGQKSVLNGAGPLYDTADPCWTIGGNTVENTGVEHWQFVGWNWEQDCFVDTSTDSGHRVLGWAPFDVATPAAPAVDAQDAARLDHLQQRGATIELLPGKGDFYPMQFRVGGRHAAVSTDIRAAIDAAIAAQAKEGREA